MDTKILTPQQSAPVARSTVGAQADLLAELSEETLTGVTASVTVTAVCVSGTVVCAYAGDDAE